MFRGVLVELYVGLIYRDSTNFRKGFLSVTLKKAVT